MGNLDERVPAIAAAQLSMLVGTGVLDRELEGREVPQEGTPIYDLEGEVLFERVRMGERTTVDLAVLPELGSPLVGVNGGQPWDPRALIDEATAALRKQQPEAGFDEVRLVAYSFPKLAVQFLDGGREVALIECHTGAPVPEEPRDDNFKRIPFRAELPRAEGRKRARQFAGVLDVSPAQLREVGLWSTVIVPDLDWATLLRRRQSRDLHFSARDGDHTVCYEVRGQQTNVWCVGASVQMILDFYRYEYTQDRLASELGLGTRANPNGLPYSQDGEVVVVLENLSSKALNATMNTSPNFNQFKSEIVANRPLVSFIPGHSRTVAGYTQTTSPILSLNFQGLLVFDPWPPNAGVITRWENFGATTYRRTFTARVALA